MSRKIPKILDFERLVESNLEATILSYKTRYFLKPGDNYGSIILGITAKTQNSKFQQNTVEFVAKMPPRQEIKWKMFQPERSCRTENAFYLEFMPIFKKFLMEKHVSDQHMLDVLPKCYGARLNAENCSNQKVDENALLVLENLEMKNYKILSRQNGFNDECTFLVLKNLAKFHAVPIAFRNEYPEIFQEFKFKYLNRFNYNTNIDQIDVDRIAEACLNDLKKIHEIVTPEDIDKARDMIKINQKYMANDEQCENTIWTTIAHYDFWVNNIMIRFDDENKPIDLKIIDFQGSQYESLAHDVIFFLFVSVENIENYSEFLKYYYDEFLKNLSSIGYPTRDYTFKKFIVEINRIAPIQFSHILHMVKIVNMKAEALPDSFDDLSLYLFEQEDIVDERYYKKLRRFIMLYKDNKYL